MTEEQKEIARLRSEIEMLRGDFTVRMQVVRLNKQIIKLNAIIDELKTIITLGKFDSLPTKTGKFTTQQIESIKNDTRTLREIASEYGVALSTVSNIRRREIYSHVDD